MKNTYTLVLLLILPLFSFAQYPTASLDIRQGYFDGGNPLPHGTRWRMNGQAPGDAQAVRVEIREKGSLFDIADYSKGIVLYEDEKSFDLLMDYPLTQGKRYDFHIVFGRKISLVEAEGMVSEIRKEALRYLHQQVYSDGKRIQLREKPRAVWKGLNDIVQRYAHPFDEEGIVYSDALLKQLQLMDGLKLKDAAHNLETDGEMGWEKKRKNYFRALMSELEASLKSETSQLLPAGTLIMQSDKVIGDYPTQKASFVLPINVGYGAVYSSGTFDNLNYGVAPYAGVSFPIGPRKTRERISLSLGVFLQDFEFTTGDVTTGPIVNRPLYAAFGVKTLRIFRITAGAAVLQDNAANGLSQVYLKPMVGLAAEINLWAGFGRPD